MPRTILGTGVTAINETDMVLALQGKTVNAHVTVSMKHILERDVQVQGSPHRPGEPP